VIEADRSFAASDSDDADLMQRILAHQEDALRILYQRHAATLFALALRVVGDRTDAEQILIDVFWEIWERADRYDSARAAPVTYLTILTRSRALDRRRRQKSAALIDSQDKSGGMHNLQDSAASPALPPLSHMLATERSQSVRDALLSLEDEERSLIEACFFDGYTHVQLAAKLRQPLGTVKTRIRRGLARLRTRLVHVFDDLPSAPKRAYSGDSEAT
jgi:RNA polymerase sigma-70 factor (ECF subfamily)